jgi:hypothetical protein
VALAGLALPVSLSPLWAEPQPNAEPIAKGSESSDAPPSPNRATKTAPPDGAAPLAVEERLQRLEKMIQVLTERLGDSPKQSAARSQPLPPLSDSAEPKSPDEPAQQLNCSQEQIDREFADALKQTRSNLDLSATNYNRWLAAKNQLAAVTAAYENETVTMDQLLEAQRRTVESYVSYAHSVGNLVGDPRRRDLFVAKAELSAVNAGLGQAREVWKKAHALAKSGEKESREEAEAREQYFHFKTEAQKPLMRYLYLTGQKAIGAETSR